MFLERFDHHHAFFWLKSVVEECNWINRQSISLYRLCNSYCWFIKKLSIAIIKMIALLLLLVSDKHVSLRVNHKFFACLKIGKSGVFYVTLFHIIIFKAAFALIQVPEFFFSFFAEIKPWILEIFLKHWLKFNHWEICCSMICARSLQINSFKLGIMKCKVFGRQIAALKWRSSSVISFINHLFHNTFLILREHGLSHHGVR